MMQLRGRIVATAVRATRTRHLALALLLPLASCASFLRTGSEVLLVEDFNGENGRAYALNYTGFANWEVIEGSVDLVGTPPFDDFLPTSQGLYVDLDGTMKEAGTLRSRESFALEPGTYRLVFKLSGTPRPNQPDNTVNVVVGNVFEKTITLRSYAPLQTYVHTFEVSSRARAHLTFTHLGGDDYGIFVDDIRFERL
jgi:hypothetical protein